MRPVVSRISKLAWIALLALTGCGGSAVTDPPGAWWVGRGPAVRTLLDDVARLEGTPLARGAREFAAALPDCAAMGVHAPDGDMAKLTGAVR